MDDMYDYFYKFVELAYVNYRTVKFNQVMGNGQDKRSALEASIALYHFREHIPEEKSKNREDLVAVCPDYDLCGDIANLAKHHSLRNNQKRKPLIKSLDVIHEVLVTTKFRDEKGDYSHGQKVVEVKTVDSSARDIFPILTNTLNMWQEELQQLGVITDFVPYDCTELLPCPREKAVNISLEMTKGLAYDQKFRFCKYNYEKGVVEPEDLSDADSIVFTVRKPLTITITLHSDDGYELPIVMQLTPDEQIQYNRLVSKEEKNKLALEVASERGLVTKMIDLYKNRSNTSKL